MNSLKVDVYNAIHQLDKQAWDDFVDESHFYHKSHFLSCLEEARVEDAKIWYVMIHDEDQLVSTAVLSSFDIHLDLMIGSHWISRLSKQIKRRFFQVKVLFCGTPVSIGHQNLFILPQYESRVIDAITTKMKKIAKYHNIKHLVFKEFVDKRRLMVKEHLLNNDYFEGHSLPYISIENEWDNYDEYWENLRSGYRRQINTSLKKSKPGSIKILKSSEFDPTLFFDWYMKVMDRTKVKLEVLNLEFFKLFFDRLSQDINLFVHFSDDDQPTSALLTISADKTLYFVWAAKPQNVDHQNDSYFNLLHEVVKYSIDNQYQMIQLGQTATYTKQRLGGKSQDVYLYYQALNPLKHWLLRSISPILFPPTILQNLKVFKERSDLYL